MQHTKIYVQKMCYSSTMPSRKQSHYRYQNKNLHLASHFGHVIFNWYKILSPNLGHKTKPPHTFFFFWSVRAGLFHCSWSKLVPSLGTRYLDWSPLISWILLQAFSFYSMWKKLCYKHRLGFASFSQSQNLLGPFLKAPARNRTLQSLPGHPQHREAMLPWGM